MADDYKIEHNVPIPEKKSRKRGKWHAVASQMKPGDSLVVTTSGQLGAIRFAIEGVGMVCVTRQIDKDTWRVWAMHAKPRLVKAQGL